MNVAILFFGQFRWFDTTHESFRVNFLPALKKHDVRYFGHFWNQKENKVDPHLKEFCQIYQPSNIIVENQKTSLEMHEYFGMKKFMHMSLLSQTYSFNKSFILSESSKQHYDLYIKLRSDLIFLNKVNIEMFDNESIYTKNISHWRPFSNYIHDYILFTKKHSNVQALAEMGFCFDDILQHPECLIYSGGSDKKIYCCEEILAKHLSSKNIKINTYDFNVDLARNHDKFSII